MPRSLWLAVSCALWSAGPARAQETRVVVVRSAADDVELGRVAAAALAAELSARGVSARIAREPPPPPSLADEIDRASVTYANLAPREAAERLDAILTRARDNGAAGLSRDQLVGAFLLRALAALAVDDADAASTAIDRVLSIDPQTALDEAQYPPTLRSALEARRPTRPDHHVLELRGVSDDARVFIDGAEASGARHALPAGLHLVRVETAVHEAWAIAVDLRADVVRDVALELDPERALASATASDAELARAARMLDVRLVRLQLDAARSGWALRAHDTATGRSARTLLGAAADVRSGAAALATGLTAAPAVARPVDTEATTADESPSIWPWIIGGAVGVAMLATLIAVLATPDQEVGRWTR